jgi:hypothetical protein
MMLRMDEDVFAAAGVDDLYDLDPGAFTNARNELARTLKAAGDTATAKLVAKLRRPTRAAYLINQVARRHRDEVTALVKSGSLVRDAQADVLSGGERAALRAAMNERREIITRLASLVPQHRDAAMATFEAASIDTDLARIVQDGHLAAEIPARSAFDFDDFDIDVAVDDVAPAPPPDNAEKIQQLEADLSVARRELADHQSYIDETEKRLEEARQRSQRAGEKVQTIESELDALRSDV